MEHLPGFDVSHYQFPPLTADRIAELRAAGYAFAGIKCSEGTYQTDMHFAANRAACRAHGFPRWLYHEATSQPPSAQIERIMEATGGILYPRERLCVVLGDFAVPVELAQSLLRGLDLAGPTKRARDGSRSRPLVLAYANRSNWRSVYHGIADERPKIVAAFPGDGSEWSIPGAVIHQDGNRDPATGGDHDLWRSGERADLAGFFQAH